MGTKETAKKGARHERDENHNEAEQSIHSGRYRTNGKHRSRCSVCGALRIWAGIIGKRVSSLFRAGVGIAWYSAPATTSGAADLQRQADRNRLPRGHRDGRQAVDRTKSGG